MRESWHDLLRGLGVAPIEANRKFEQIAQGYSGPGRFYQTLDPDMNVLSTVESLASYAKNLNAVKLAAWLHDVIYDAKALSSEERRAEYAERLGFLCG